MMTVAAFDGKVLTNNMVAITPEALHARSYGDTWGGGHFVWSAVLGYWEYFNENVGTGGVGPITDEDGVRCWSLGISRMYPEAMNCSGRKYVGWPDGHYGEYGYGTTLDRI